MKSESDSTPFAVHWSRLWSVFIVTVAGMFTAIAALMAYKALPDSPFGSLFAGLFAAVMGFALYRGMHNLVTPALLFEVRQDGIASYFWELNYGDDPLFLPWSDVAEIELIDRLAGGGGNRHSWSLAVSVTRTEDIPAARSTGGSGDPKVLHLDATIGTMRRDELLTRTRAVWQAHTSASG